VAALKAAGKPDAVGCLLEEHPADQVLVVCNRGAAPEAAFPKGKMVARVVAALGVARFQHPAA